MQSAAALVLGGWLAGSAGCNSNLRSQWQGPFFFVQLADPQLGMKSSNADTGHESPALERAIHCVNQLGPAFVVICGDLVNEPMNEAQAAEFHRVLGGLDERIPVFLVAGNHDVGNTPTPETLDWYHHRFGEDAYAFDFAGCRGIVLNSAVIHAPEQVRGPMWKQEQWLMEELERTARRDPVHVFVFQHHPFFVNEVDEADGYANIPLRSRPRYLKYLDQADVSAVFTGHRHAHGTSRYRDINLITTGSVTNAFDDAGPGFRIVKVYEDRIEHEFHSYDRMPVAVDLPGLALAADR